jgi:hypothetical protein
VLGPVDPLRRGLSSSYRSQCRPGTGAASGKCQPGAGATVESMNRTFTSSGRIALLPPPVSRSCHGGSFGRYPTENTTPDLRENRSGVRGGGGNRTRRGGSAARLIRGHKAFLTCDDGLTAGYRR